MIILRYMIITYHTALANFRIEWRHALRFDNTLGAD